MIIRVQKKGISRWFINLYYQSYYESNHRIDLLRGPPLKLFERQRTMFSQETTYRTLICKIDEGKFVSFLKESLANLSSSKYIYLDIALFHSVESYRNTKERPHLSQKRLTSLLHTSLHTQLIKIYQNC